MMTYFEICDRLEKLTEFRRLYREYLDFTNRAGNLPAQALLRQMEPMIVQTVDSLNRVGLGAIITRDAPARGGKKVKINQIRAIFRDRVREHYHLDENAPVKLLDEGILLYTEWLARQKLQLFNPLFWLYEFAGFLADLPLVVCHRAGYDTRSFESRSSVRILRLGIQIAVIVLVVYAVVSPLVPARLIAFDILP